MGYQEGYVYHIKDEYFIKAKDPNLMQNKENGNYRPTFYCMRDEKISLLWLVPFSSHVEKFQAVYDKQIEKYGNCLTMLWENMTENRLHFFYRIYFRLQRNLLTIYIPVITILYPSNIPYRLKYAQK